MTGTPVILVAGGTAAGPSAAAKAAREHPSASVTLFEAGETVSYGVCEIPYAVAGLIPGSALEPYTAERLAKKKRLTVRTRHMVEAVDPANRTVSVRSLGDGRVLTVRYDALVIATGAAPRIPGAESGGRDTLDSSGAAAGRSDNLFPVRGRAELLRLDDYLTRAKPSSAVIAGGGYAGLEMAEALSARGIRVTMLHGHALPLNRGPEAMRRRIAEELEANGVAFRGGVRARGFVRGSGWSSHSDHSIRAVETGAAPVEAGLFIVTAGLTPAVALAKQAGAAIGKSGAVSTDERCSTTVPGVYAAGDCAEVADIVSGKPVYVPLATVANRAGKVAGTNAAGGDARFPGALRSMAFKVFQLEVAAAGLTRAEAAEAGFDADTAAISSWTKVAAMPGAGRIDAELVFERPGGRILGATLWGAGGTAARINVLAAALQQRMSVGEIASLDLVYAPPFSPLWDPVLIAARTAQVALGRALP